MLFSRATSLYETFPFNSPVERQKFSYAKIDSWILKFSRTRAPSVAPFLHLLCPWYGGVQGEVNINTVHQPQANIPNLEHHTSKGRWHRTLSWSYLPTFIMSFIAPVKVFPHPPFPFQSSTSWHSLPHLKSQSSSAFLGKPCLATPADESEYSLPYKTIMVVMMKNIY